MPHMIKFWPFTFSFLQFASIASVMPFLVLYYQSLGFNGPQIGLLTGITPLIIFVSAPLWTGFADAKHKHRLMMSLAILGSVIALFIFPYPIAFLQVGLIAILLFFCLGPITPFADSATMFMLAGERELYGRIRLGGTIGFGLVAPVAGLFVQNYGSEFAFWIGGALLFLGFFVSLKLVYGRAKIDNPVKGRVRVLLSNPRWLLFLIVAFAGGMAMVVYNNYLFPYMKELGANESMMGIALMVGTISEIPVLFFGNRLIRRFKAYGLLMLSMVVTGLRLLLFATAGTPSAILVIQLLNGLTFPAMWVAGVSYAYEKASADMSSTAQGLFTAMVFGVGSAVGGFIGGLLLESIGGRGLYYIFGIVVLAIVGIVGLVHRRLPVEQMPSLNAVVD